MRPIAPYKHLYYSIANTSIANTLGRILKVFKSHPCWVCAFSICKRVYHEPKEMTSKFPQSNPPVPLYL